LGINHNYNILEIPFGIVPADICSNAVLVTSAFAAQEPLPGFHVFHNTNNTVSPELYYGKIN